MTNYDLSKLDWDNRNIKKDWCLANTKILFGMQNINMGPDANSALKFCDKTDKNTFEIGDVLIIGASNPVFVNSPAGYKYGHIGVIIENSENYVIMSDGNKAYPKLKLYKSKIYSGKYGVISPQKIIELGATRIILNDLIKQIMNNYKEIFKKEFPNGSTIFKDLDNASKDLISPEQLAYFIAIGLERVKQYGNRHNTSI